MAANTRHVLGDEESHPHNIGGSKRIAAVSSPFPMGDHEWTGDDQKTPPAPVTLAQKLGLMDFFSLNVWRASIGELIGTAVLVFMIDTIVISTFESDIKMPNLVMSVLITIVITILLLAVFPVSGGHINPIISFSAALVGIISMSRAVIYMVAQCVGATLGALALKAVVSSSIENTFSLGGCTLTVIAPGPNGPITVGLEMAQAFWLEIFCSFVFLFASIWMAYDHRQAERLGLVKVLSIVGMVLGLLVFVSTTVTATKGYAGAGMNPARCFGAAVVRGGHLWDGHQSEIVLRVKQGDNPTFGFLMPDHYVHPYYRFLVDHQELLNSDGKPQNEERKDVNEPDGALSLLGSVYGSGEDEDAPNNMASNEAVDVSYTAQEKGESSANVPRQDEIISKHPPPSGSGLDKEKSHLLKKNPLISGSKNGSTSRKKLKDDSISASVSAALEKIKASGLGTFKIEPVVLEPPSDLKNLIGKIVEFIVKNGKQFEATLIEQDSKHGRFPFLLPSNMYHPYYLKVLHGAQESKVSGKSLHSGIDDSIGQGLEKRASLSKEGGSLPFGSGEGDVPYEFDKKEKFKMVIGKSKKESQEPLDKGQQQEHGFSVDAAAAAAILQAAARGIKNPNIGILSKAAVNANSQGNTTDGSLGTITSSGHDNMTAGSRAIAKSNAEADSSETQLSKEQKLKAERLKKAKMFVAMLKNGAAPRGVSMEPPESGLSGSGTELNHRGEQREGSSAPLDGDVSDQGGRLKPGDEYNERRSMRKYRSRSGRHEVDEDGEGERKQQSTRKEHYSSMKNGGEESEDVKDHKRSKRKHHRSHYSDEEEASDKCEEERGHRHSRKKHHQSHHSDEDEASDKHEEEIGHRHSRKKHHRSHYSDEDEHEASDKYEEERGHRHSRKKHRSHRTSNKYDDEEERDEENSRHSRKKHKSHRSHHSSHNKNKHKRLKEASDDEQHRHKSNKHSKGTAEREDLEEGEISGKVSDQSKGSLGGTISREASQDISSPRQRAPSEPSDDLRAKIRAMLMETRR